MTTKPTTKKKALVPLILLLAGAAAAAGIFASRKTVERQDSAVLPPLVRTQAVEPRDIPLIVRGHGDAVPAITTTLAAQVSGRVAAVGPSFAEGASFRRGDLLLEIEQRDYELNVAQAEAGVAQALVRVDRERAEAELARREWQELGRGEAAPLAARAPQVAEAEAALGSAEASLEMARLSLSRTTVRAPFDGQLRSKRVDLGQFVNPGSPLAEIFSISNAEVALPVPQNELAFLDIDWTNSRPGPQVELRGMVAGDEHTWGGRVVRTSGEIDPRTRTTMLYVRIEGRMSSGTERSVPLPMGIFLEAAVAGRTAEGVAVLPRSALREGDRVLVVDGDGRLRFRPVEVLRLQDDEALISGGLEAGEEVCVSPLEAPVDGMRVRTQAAAAEVTAGEARL
jgi:RND family efflux transporter MFP subunit